MSSGEDYTTMRCRCEMIRMIRWTRLLFVRSGRRRVSSEYSFRVNNYPLSWLINQQIPSTLYSTRTSAGAAVLTLLRIRMTHSGSAAMTLPSLAEPTEGRRSNRPKDDGGGCSFPASGITPAISTRSRGTIPIRERIPSKSQGRSEAPVETVR
jgi:hypothetical protein